MYPRRGPIRPLSIIAVLLALGLTLAFALRLDVSPAPRSTDVGSVARNPAAGTPAAERQRDEAARPRSNQGFVSRERWLDHYEKHGAEFGSISADEYLRRAQALRDAPVGGDILEAVRADGVITRYDRKSGAFIAVNRSGTIRTFFRPNDGERYFHRQKERSG